MLPCTSHGLGFAWNILKHLNLLRCARKLKASFAAGIALLDGIEVVLQGFDCGCKFGVFIIKLTVVSDLVGEAPIILGGDGSLEGLKVSSRTVKLPRA